MAGTTTAAPVAPAPLVLRDIARTVFETETEVEALRLVPKIIEQIGTDRRDEALAQAIALLIPTWRASFVTDAIRGANAQLPAPSDYDGTGDVAAGQDTGPRVYRAIGTDGKERSFMSARIRANWVRHDRLLNTRIKARGTSMLIADVTADDALDLANRRRNMASGLLQQAAMWDRVARELQRIGAGATVRDIRQGDLLRDMQAATS